ncbi:MAG TPA: metallophosphoesterase [Calditrichaeota bacterium]|nr:metallophosphoesterase [Calditrichota bacterium]
MGKFFIFILLLLFMDRALFAQDRQSISGIVFEDLNRNGKMDKGEPGITGVAVSNQREVVLTDRQGRYTLPARTPMIVFVSKPAGYAIPLKENNLPDSYYIHQPDGSPSYLEYPGIRPTGPLPSSLNFALYRQEEADTIHALIVGDPQPRDNKEVAYFRNDILNQMSGIPADFYLALGDIAYDNLKTYPPYLEAVSVLNVPQYNVLGNHDMNYRAKDDGQSAETFKRYFGPADYSFNYGKTHFIILDNVQYMGWDSVKNKHGRYRGFLNKQQLQWLKNDLRFVPQDHLIVVAVHIPFFSPLFKGEAVNVGNRDLLFKLLEDRGHLLFLSGHMHFSEHFLMPDSAGWRGKAKLYRMNLGAGCGAWWSGPKDERDIPLSYCLDGTPNGFYRFSFFGDQFDYRFYPANLPQDFQIHIVSPPDTVANTDSVYIIANVFNADPQARVTVKLDSGVPFPMSRYTGKDPFIENYLQKYKDNFPHWINRAARTLHLWKADLPKDLTVGVHLIEVQATDWLGHTYRGRRVFEFIQ